MPKHATGPLISDAVSADYAWDLANPGVVLADSTGGYGEVVSGRVASVPNSGSVSGFPLVADAGAWATAALTSPSGAMPGPLFIDDSERFGRPCCRFDSLNVNLDNFWSVPGHALLASTVDPTDTSTFFVSPDGHPQPFDVAVLCRPDGAPFPSSQSAIDTYEPEGGPTIGIKAGNWSLLTGLPPHLHPATAVPVDEDATVLLVARLFEDSSFLEVNWRDADGVVQTDRTAMTLSNLGNFTNCFFGGTHAGYLSAAAVKVGSWSESEIDSLRSWAVRSLPNVAALVVESGVARIYDVDVAVAARNVIDGGGATVSHDEDAFDGGGASGGATGIIECGTADDLSSAHVMSTKNVHGMKDTALLEALPTSLQIGDFITDGTTTTRYTGTPRVVYCQFPDSSTSYAHGQWVPPPWCSAVNIDYYWTADASVAGNVRWQVSIAALSDAVDVSSPGATNTAVNLTANGTASLVSSDTRVASNLSVVSGTPHAISISRVGANAGDTLAANARLLAVVITPSG